MDAVCNILERKAKLDDVMEKNIQSKTNMRTREKEQMKLQTLQQQGDPEIGFQQVKKFIEHDDQAKFVADTAEQIIRDVKDTENRRKERRLEKIFLRAIKKSNENEGDRPLESFRTELLRNGLLKVYEV